MQKQPEGRFSSKELTTYWLNWEQCVTGSEGGSQREHDKLHGYTWVREIKICVVCGHFPCQNNHASEPPFTFYPASPSSPWLPALTRTSQAGIIELTTSWDRQLWLPHRPNLVAPLMCLILPPRPQPYDLQGVWFCPGYSGLQIPKANFPPLISLSGCFLKLLKPSPVFSAAFL